MTVILVTQV